MKTEFPPSAILFDLDGVLIASMEHHFHSWREIMGRFGIELTWRDVALGEGERAEDSMRRFFLEKANKLVSEPEIDELVREKRLIYRESKPPKLLPEARELIEYLRAKNVTLGIVSGSARVNLQQSLTETEMDWFSVIITGDMGLPGKPDAAPYREAIKRLDFSANECWVIENAPLGIRAARAAGATVIALQSTLPKDDLPGAQYYIESIRDVRNLFNTACEN